MSNQLQDDTACIAKWQELVGKFNKLIEGNPPAEKIRKELDQLKEDAKASSVLTGRQIEGLVARCNNYAIGNWGSKAFTPSAYDASRQSKPSK